MKMQVVVVGFGSIGGSIGTYVGISKKTGISRGEDLPKNQSMIFKAAR
jgi:prephenate dehydrogenase